MAIAIAIDRQEIAAFCRRHHIRKLALFGSVLRRDFRPDSDVDVLVEFEPGHPVGLIRLAGIERELSGLLGRKADIRTPADLSRYFRDEVVASAEVQYEEGRSRPPAPHAGGGPGSDGFRRRPQACRSRS
jgi:predicted nucleotidyltransferase